MSIASVRTELIQSNVADQNSDIRTDLTQTIAIGADSRESSSAVLTDPTSYFGKSLDKTGNNANVRGTTTARNTSPLTPLV